MLKATNFTDDENIIEQENDVLSEFEDKKPSRQEIYRKALAEYAKVAASGGETKAEIAYYDYLEKNLKSN